MQGIRRQLGMESAWFVPSSNGPLHWQTMAISIQAACMSVVSGSLSDEDEEGFSFALNCMVAKVLSHDTAKVNMFSHFHLGVLEHSPEYLVHSPLVALARFIVLEMVV